MRTRRPKLAGLSLGGNWVLLLVGVPAQVAGGLLWGLVVSFVNVGLLVGNQLIEICVLRIVFRGYNYSSLGPSRMKFYFSSKLLRPKFHLISVTCTEVGRPN
jgi:hypothetical protein